MILTLSVMPFGLLNMFKMRLVEIRDENSANNVDVNKGVCFSPYAVL